MELTGDAGHDARAQLARELRLNAWRASTPLGAEQTRPLEAELRPGRRWGDLAGPMDDAHVCSACREELNFFAFSRSQMNKGPRRRCEECVTTGRPSRWTDDSESERLLAWRAWAAGVAGSVAGEPTPEFQAELRKRCPTCRKHGPWMRTFIEVDCTVCFEHTHQHVGACGHGCCRECLSRI